MKKFIITIIFFIQLLAGYTLVSAQGQTITPIKKEVNTSVVCPDGQYCLLEPLPNPNGGADITQIDLNDLPGYIKTIFKIIMGIIGILAVVMIILGGVQYMSTDAISGKEGGKETVTRAVGGLILALGAYIILNTINPHLLDLNFASVVPQDVVATIDYETSEGVLNDGITNSTGQKMYCGYGGGTPWGTDPVIKAGDDNIRNVEFKKAQYNASVNKSNCPSVGSSGCTSVYGLDISGLAKLRTKCPLCSLVVTGGTECWLHSSAKKTTHGPSVSHSPGSSIVDLSKTDSLKNYVFSGTKSCVGWNPNKTTCTQSNGQKGDWQYVKDGIIFMDEGDHFHVKSW